MKTMTILVSLALLFTNIAHAEAPKVHLYYTLSKGGSNICDDSKIMAANDEVLLCEGTSKDLKISLRALVESVKEGEYFVRAKVEEINGDNVIKILGSPGVASVANEAAEVTQSISKEETIKLTVTVNPAL